MARQISSSALLALALLPSVTSCNTPAGPGKSITVTLALSPPQAPAGGSTQLAVNAVPLGDAEITSVRIQATGVVTSDETVPTQGTGPQFVVRTFQVPLQPGTGEIDFTVTATGTGVTGTAQLRANVFDNTPPTVTGSIALPGIGQLVPGDTLRLTLTATDNHRVAWLGYRLGAPAATADSAPQSAASVNTTVSLVIQPSWLGTWEMSAFARDSTGSLGSAALATVEVVNAVRRPARTVTLDAAVRDVAIDTLRHALYLSQPDSQRVAVLSLSTMTFGPPIALFGSPSGLDLSVGGDSLVVALRRSSYLAVVNLKTGQVDTVRLNFAVSFNAGPDNIRVMANQKALVTIAFDGSGYGGQVLEYDLSSGAQRVRTDAGINQSVTEHVPMARATNRSTVLFLIDDSCCPIEGDVYYAASDTIGVKAGTVSGFFFPASSDATGSRFLIGESLFDGTLNPIVELTPQHDALFPSVLDQDATAAYFARDRGYLKLRIPDGAVLERVVLPETPVRLMMLPGGQQLVAVMQNAVSGALSLSVVDLQ